MNNSEKILINQLLKGQEYLISEFLYKRGYEFVKSVLENETLAKDEYKDLRTSNIWVSKKNEIETKLNLTFWKDDRYKHLLKPTIFSINSSQIKNNILLLEKYCISSFITINCLRKNTYDLEQLIEFLIEKEIELVVDDKKGGKKLTPILSASNKVLKEKYGIDIKNIRQRGRAS